MWRKGALIKNIYILLYVTYTISPYGVLLFLVREKTSKWKHSCNNLVYFNHDDNPLDYIVLSNGVFS